MSYEANGQKSYLEARINIDTDITFGKLKDTIDILQAEIDSLNLELDYKKHELKELDQELRFTNQELCAAINLKQLNLDEAIKIARNLLIARKPTKDFVAELLSAIYSSSVTKEQLE